MRAADPPGAPGLTAAHAGLDIAVLIPCFNEAMTIGKVVGDFRSALPQARIYVYDNNSRDGTAEAAVRAGLWAGPAWERLWIEAGRVIHEGEDHR